MHEDLAVRKNPRKDATMNRQNNTQHRHPSPTHAVLFLDVDGVLNSTRSRTLFGNDRVDPDALGGLKNLLATLAPDVSVVLSSTWRVPHLGKSRKHLVDALPFLRNLPMHAHAPMTPHLPHAARGDEVLAWLAKQDHKGPYVVLDDLSVDAVTDHSPQDLVRLASSVLLVDGRSGFGTPYHLEALTWMLTPNAQAA
jgi:hypothetical protein